MVQRVKVKSLLIRESLYHRMYQEEAMLRRNRVQLDLLRYYKKLASLDFLCQYRFPSIFASLSFIYTFWPIFKECGSAKKWPAVFLIFHKCICF